MSPTLKGRKTLSLRFEINTWLILAGRPDIRLTQRQSEAVLTIEVSPPPRRLRAMTNYVVTVTSGTLTTTFPGSFTGVGDVGAGGAGTLITTVHH